MPEYTSTLLFVFILVSCVYKKHVRDWGWFRFGVICYLVSLALGPLTSVLAGSSLFRSRSPFDLLFELIAAASALAAVGGVIMACIKNVEIDSQHIHCLKCGYILKGLTEPRCPECGERI